NPARWIWPATGPPILPRPMKPTVSASLMLRLPRPTAPSAARQQSGLCKQFLAARADLLQRTGIHHRVRVERDLAVGYLFLDCHRLADALDRGLARLREQRHHALIRSLGHRWADLDVLDEQGDSVGGLGPDPVLGVQQRANRRLHLAAAVANDALGGGQA